MPILFADDSNLFLNGRDPADIEAKLNNELAQIAEWLKVNKLALNIDKNSMHVVWKQTEVFQS